MRNETYLIAFWIFVLALLSIILAALEDARATRRHAEEMKRLDTMMELQHRCVAYEESIEQ